MTTFVSHSDEDGLLSVRNQFSCFITSTKFFVQVISILIQAEENVC